MPTEDKVIEVTATEAAKKATDKKGIIFMIGGIIVGTAATVGVIEGGKAIKRQISKKKEAKAAKKAEKAE